MGRREAFVQAMIDIANDDSHGYDQAHRWGPDYDCSSMTYEAAYRAGYDISYDDPRYTGTIIEDFTRAGFRCDTFDGNLGDLEPGDILLNTAYHVAVYIGGGQLAEASGNEWGGITGGQAGDQTGWEIHIGPVYNYPWTHILTPPSEGGSGGGGSVPVDHNGVMHGIDVSSHDQAPFKDHTEWCYGGSDFVIAKSTQGTWYENPCFDYAYNRAKADGKLLGIYHYAAGEGARAEAEYFYAHTADRIGEFIPWLDWESIDNDNWGSTTWCREFVDRYHELSGVYPGIYVQASAIWQCENCADVSPLWVAGYPSWTGDNWDPQPGDMPYGIGAWDDWTIWQYTSDGGTDRNVANIDANAWAALAGGSEDIVTPQDIQDIALAVWAFQHDGVQMRDKMHGIDVAANDVRNQLNNGYMAERVWAFPICDVQARDRLYGIDLAANNVNNHLPAIMEAIKAVADSNGVDISGIADEVQAAVAETLEKINLQVKVNE